MRLERARHFGDNSSMLSTMRTGDIASSSPENGDTISNVANGGGGGKVNNIGGPLFCCPDCAYKTTSLRKLGRHRSVNHAGVKYRCEHCDFVTGYQSNYYRHRKQVHNGGMSQSALQAAATNSISSVQQQHSQSQQHSMTRQPTISGSATFRGNQNNLSNSMPNFVASMTEEHQRLIAAAIMASSTTTTSTNIVAFRCDRCPFQATNADQLAAHISLLHSADGQRTCGECGITLATKNQWQEHLRIYHQTPRNQSSSSTAAATIFSKNDYTNFFNSLANNNAALTAAHLIMAAAANGGSTGLNGSTNGYDLNLLASAAALTSSNGLLVQQQQLQQIHDQNTIKTLDSKMMGNGGQNKSDDDTTNRYYACVYDCDFAARSSKEYLHHLRDEHGERFAIFYCDRCDEYATKFVARLRRHKALVHDVDEKLTTITKGEEKEKFEENGSKKSRMAKNGENDDDEDEDEDEEDIEERKLSIVIDQQNFDVKDEQGEEIDGLFRCTNCPYSTNELIRFKKHVKCHETTTAVDETRCQFCNFRTIYSWNLDRHLNCHRRMGKYICRRCSFAQNTRQSMQFHLQNHHQDIRSKNIETQTDFDNWSPNVDVDFETFIFEKHAVEVNQEFVCNNMDDDEMVNGIEEMPSSNEVDNHSPILDLSKNGRHSTPTPPALMAANGNATSTNILQENRRRQMFNNKFHYRRRQHQNGYRSMINQNQDSRRMRKFLSEQEAIEIPSDSIGNEFDNDPDIKNRHCSVCGYQGKWISEMIRHKRVHTNERPFRCKYCSRTSKWKADLIRHVAKVHGYRVVSKYSRSKTFDDADKTALKALKEAAQSSTTPPINGRNHLSPRSMNGKTRESPIPENAMDFDEELIEEAVEEEMNGHQESGQEEDEIIEDEQLEKEKEIESQITTNQQSVDAAALLFRQLCTNAVQLNDSNGSSSPTSSILSSIAPPRPSSKELRDLIGSKQLTGALEKYIMIKQADGGGEATLKCRVCPYETRDLHTFRAHTQKHENKKPYLCSTCGYRSNWSSDVHKHIRLKKTGHETAYVIKLNELESPAAQQIGDSPSTLGRISSNSDSSSNDFNTGDSQNRSSNTSTSPNTIIDGKNVGQVAWRCLKCDFEDDSKSMVIEHLQLIHRTPPFACRYCDFNSSHRKSCIYHVQSQHNSRDSNILENLVCEYRSKGTKIIDLSSTTSFDGAPPNTVVGDEKKLQPFKKKKIDSNGHQLDQATTAAVMAANAAAAFATGAFPGLPSSKSVDWLQLAQLCFLGGLTGFQPNTGPSFATESATNCEENKSSTMTANGENSTKPIVVTENLHRCDKCPYVGRSELDSSTHEKGHRAPNKGLMCYKCVFCEWYAPKKTSIFEHLSLHTDQPGIYKSEVERNMITPLSRKRTADEDVESAAANALLGLAKSEKVYKLDREKSMKTKSTISDIDGDGLLGRSDVDEVMSDFNAIIHAADQDLAQERDVEFSINQKSVHETINGLANAVKQSNANMILASTEKIWMSKMKANFAKTTSTDSSNGGDSMMKSDLRTLDREAYIHAGEDALDSLSRLGEVPKGEIQKVTAVVDGQIRKMWQCRHCPHMSKRRANVRMHEKKHFKSSAIGVFKCPKCNYRGDKRSLHVHYRVHMAAENGGSATMPELFQCTNCPAIFLSQEDLALHLINHNNTLTKGYRCTRCSYGVTSSSALQKHARVHDRQLINNNNNNVETTPIDERTIKRQSYLNNRRHTNSAAIANVIVQHEEINPVMILDKEEDGALNLVTRGQTMKNSTPSPNLLDVGGGHSMVVKPKKYLCTRCPAKFADRTQLNRHVQFHGVKLKFKCYICDYSVPFPINLTKHMKSHHNMDVTDVSNACVSLSDNENESDLLISAGDLDDASVSSSSEYEEDEIDGGNNFGSGSFTASPLDGSLKIKINLGALKSSSPSVA